MIARRTLPAKEFGAQSMGTTLMPVLAVVYDGRREALTMRLQLQQLEITVHTRRQDGRFGCNRAYAPVRGAIGRFGMQGLVNQLSQLLIVYRARLVGTYFVIESVDALIQKSETPFAHRGARECKCCAIALLGTPSATASTMRRYYATSLPPDAARIAHAVRSHWRIENSVHWVLDVAFGEDQWRVLVDNAAQNFAILCQITMNLLRHDTSTKAGIKIRRLKATTIDHFRFDGHHSDRVGSQAGYPSEQCRQRRLLSRFQIRGTSKTDATAVPLPEQQTQPCEHEQRHRTTHPEQGRGQDINRLEACNERDDQHKCVQ